MDGKLVHVPGGLIHVRFTPGSTVVQPGALRSGMKTISRALPLAFALLYGFVAVGALTDLVRMPQVSGDWAMMLLDVLLVACAAPLAAIELALAIFARPRRLRWHVKTWVAGLPAIIAAVGMT